MINNVKLKVSWTKQIACHQEESSFYDHETSLKSDYTIIVIIIGKKENYPRNLNVLSINGASKLSIRVSFHKP